MATKTEIANMALALIGARPVENITEQSSSADIINQIYEMTRKSVLESHAWTFATTTQELVATSNTPPDWSYEFALPADIITLISPAESGRDFTDDQYEVRGTYLYADTDELTVRYVYDITDTSKFTALFAEALAYLIASKIATSLTGDASIQSNMAGGYISAILQARGMDAARNRLNRVQSDGYIKSRI